MELSNWDLEFVIQIFLNIRLFAGAGLNRLYFYSKGPRLGSPFVQLIP
jgi:hypothetical protein